VFNLDTKTKLKAHQMPEPVEFWKWVSPTMLGLVTATSVYHWDVEVRPLPWLPRGARGGHESSVFCAVARAVAHATAQA
jgi:hypothetical protein